MGRGSRRALRARAGSRRGRRGHPVLQEPALGAADSERRNCPGVRGVLSEVPEGPMSAAAAKRYGKALVKQPPGPPLILGHARARRAAAAASCLNDACRHEGLIDVSKFPADTEVPSFAGKAVCAK